MIRRAVDASWHMVAMAIAVAALLSWLAFTGPAFVVARPHHPPTVHVTNPPESCYGTLTNSGC